MSNHLQLRLRHKPTAPNLLQKLDAFLQLLKRPIHTVQNAIDLRVLQRRGKRRQRKHAARRDPHVLVPDLAQLPRPGGPRPNVCIAPLVREVDDAIEAERHHFAHVTEDQLQRGELVEDAGAVHAHEGDAAG